MMTKDEARHTVEAELRSRKLTKPTKSQELAAVGVGLGIFLSRWRFCSFWL
jgi:hypothetical protein